jgi:protein-S-isoprenylcysteine O-methyltransferase Ste14
MLGVVWNVENQVGRVLILAVFWLGWLIVFLSTFMINHFDLFGLRQVYLKLTGKEYSSLVFTESFLYRYVRHPIMLGFIIAFWATPQMTTGHLLFAIATTLYILVGIRLEERDLSMVHGVSYENYRRRVSMIVPVPGKKKVEISSEEN